MSYVPNRAHSPKRRVYITNGDLGTDNQQIREYAHQTPQGMAALRKTVDAHAERTGKPSWAETYDDSVKMGNTEPRVLYGKKTK